MKKELNKKKREFCCAGKGNKNTANSKAKTILSAITTALCDTRAVDKKTRNQLDVGTCGRDLPKPEEIQAWNE